MEHVLDLLRAQRHSHMNHLQVVSGWLQLGQSDRALQYLRRLGERMEREGEALRRLPSALAVSVLRAGLFAETLDVEFAYRVEPGVEGGEAAAARLEAFLREVAAAAGGGTVEVSLSPGAAAALGRRVTWG